MVSGFYFVTFLMALAMTFINVFRSKKADTRFVLVGLAVTLNCFGRYMVSVSETLELAIASNKVLYLGGTFVLPIIIVSIVDLYGFQMNKWIKGLLFAFAVITYGFVLTTGHNDLYYKSVELVYQDGYHYLEKVYGPAHILYPTYMIICVLILLYYLVMAFRKRQLVSFRIVLVVATASISIVLCYLLEKLFDSTIEWMTVGYLFANGSLIYLFDQFNMYDMSINLSNYVERMKEYGYIVFDKKMRYINSNDYAKTLFPEIKDWYSGEVVKPEESLIYREVVQDINRWKQEETVKGFYVDDTYVELTIDDISYGRKENVVGSIIEIVDKTVQQKYIQTMEAYNDDLEKEVEEKTADILRIKDMLVLGMAAMVESRDNSTGGHIRRTSDVVRIFAKHLLQHGNDMGLTKGFLDMVVKAAPMHDLGKIAVDDRVLRKQGKFTDEEYEEMKKHSEEGARTVTAILDDVEDEAFVNIAGNVAHYHHEKWNGKGYPCQLSGEDIPVEARIMALADVFDALVSKRCYKEAFTYDKAFSIIEEDLGSHFDPVLGKLFLECRSDLEELYNQYGEG